MAEDSLSSKRNTTSSGDLVLAHGLETPDSSPSSKPGGHRRPSSGKSDKNVRLQKSSEGTVRFQTGDDELDAFDDAPLQSLSFSHTNSIASERSVVSRKSVVGDAVLDAWITKGWTLRQSMISNQIDIDPGLEVDIDIEERTQAAQKRIQQLNEVNKALHSSLISKKQLKETLTDKIQDLDGLLTSGQEVEEGARQMSLFEAQDDTQNEERRMQDMQLELSQSISETEAEILKIEGGNEYLQNLNGSNKRLLREQHSEIKERQKAIRHLQRQIQVLEGASSSMKRGTYKALTEHLTRTNSLTNLSDDGDTNSEPHHRQTSKREISNPGNPTDAQQKLDHSTPRTLEDYKALPGLNLSLLLGEA